MSEDPPPERCRVVALVGDPADGSVLADAGTARLPEAVVAGTARSFAVEDTLRRLVPGAGAVRRVTPVERPRGRRPAIVALEAEPPPATPLGLARYTLRDVALLEPASLAAFADWWHGRLTGDPSPLDPPWSAPGWLAAASAWMVTQLAERGTPPAAPPRIASMWPISAILVASSPDGRRFLKVAHQVFGAEARVTAALAARTPHAVTPVEAVEAQEGWLLMRDLGERSLGDEPEDRWDEGLLRLADAQLAWADAPDALVAAGATRRPLAELAEAVPSMATDPAVVGQLPPDDARRIAAAVPRLVTAIRRLAALGPPDGLVHGDLHPGNVSLGAGGPVLFDWTDAAVSHPFLDLVTYLGETRAVAARRRMRARYLERWRDRMPAAALEEAGELAIPVGCAYQADSYRRIFAGLDPHDQAWFRGADAAWLRSAAVALDEGIRLRGDE